MRVTHIEEGRNETTIFVFDNGSWLQVKQDQVEALGQHLAKEFGEPLLGLATTQQMLEELITRFEIPNEFGHSLIELIRHDLTEKELAYRTVDS